MNATEVMAILGDGQRTRAECETAWREYWLAAQAHEPCPLGSWLDLETLEGRYDAQCKQIDRAIEIAATARAEAAKVLHDLGYAVAILKDRRKLPAYAVDALEKLVRAQTEIEKICATTDQGTLQMLRDCLDGES